MSFDQAPPSRLAGASDRKASEATKAPISVQVAVRVIAGGIFERKDQSGTRRFARATLALTPVAPDGSGKEALAGSTIDLAQWPAEIERRLKAFEITLWSVGADGARGVTPPDDLPRVRMASISHPVPNISEYWNRVMGGTEGLEKLTATFAAPQPLLADLTRPPVGGGTGRTPDIIGMERSQAATSLTLERARQILDRIACRTRDTRSVPGPDERRRALHAAANASLKSAGQSATGTSSGSGGRDQVESYTKAYDAHADSLAQQDLQGARKQADALAEARTAYLRAGTSLEAVEKLLQGRGPVKPVEAQAKCWQDPTATDKTDITAAAAAMRLASSGHQPSLTGNGPNLKGPDAATQFAQRRLFALQAHPSLARLFRFVIDVECPLSDLMEALEPGAARTPTTIMEADVYDQDVPPTPRGDPPSALPPQKMASRTFYVLMSATLTPSESLPSIWTLAKLRPEGAGHFYPCTREEVDVAAAEMQRRPGESAYDLRALALAEQIDGLVDLGQKRTCSEGSAPRFDIMTLDAITAVAADVRYNLSQALAVEARSSVGEPAATPAARLERNTLRSGGLALVDRWRQSHAIDRFVTSQRQNERRPQNGAAPPAATEDAFKGGILLDASDLTIGYKLDVGVLSKRDPIKSRRRWHTLMRRNVAFQQDLNWAAKGLTLDDAISRLYPDRLARLRADDGILNVAAALRPNSGQSDLSAFTEEIIGAWRGDPLGLAAASAEARVARDDLLVGMTLSLPTRSEGEDFTPPPLRFGWRYHFGMRAVFAGGISMPLERALGHYERSHRGDLILPAASVPGRSFRRHERLDAPQVLVPDWAFGAPAAPPSETGREVRLPGPFGAEQGERLIIRTVENKDNRSLLGLDPKAATTERSFARRILLPPSVTLDFAGLHGALDRVDVEKDIRDIFTPRLLAPQETAADDEAIDEERVAAYSNEGKMVWTTQRVAWRRSPIVSRPVGGLRNVDHRAAWGGFPIFRMKTLQRTKAVDDQAVAQPPDTVTDIGEIVHQDVVRELRTTKNKLKLKVDWRAVAGIPSGSAVFRPLPPGTPRQERRPFYPDPAATHLVIVVDVPGHKPDTAIVPLYLKDTTAPTPPGYPNVLPVVLDVKPLEGARKPGDTRRFIRFANDQPDGVRLYSDKAELDPSPNGPVSGSSIAVRHVIVSLAPGEEASIKVWCLPGTTFLEHMFEATESVAALCTTCGCTLPERLTSEVEANEACRTGFQSLTGQTLSACAPQGSPTGRGVAGLPLPGAEQVQQIALRLSETLKASPLPEVAAVLDLTAVHAVDLPQAGALYSTTIPAESLTDKPLPLIRMPRARIEAITKPDGNDPLGAPAQWTAEHQVDGGCDVALAGLVTMDGASTGAIEIEATGAALARGRFDDVDLGRTRDDRARGIWPTLGLGRDARMNEVFGFDIWEDGRVGLRRETVTLLRVDGFGPETQELDLIEIQRKASLSADRKTPADRALRALRPTAIADPRARYITLNAVALARHTALLRTRYGELPTTGYRRVAPLDAERVSKPELTSLWLPATVRPARPAPMSIVPSFLWKAKPDHPAQEVSIERTSCLRVRLPRPSFSSGEDERIGIVLWPPNLFDLPAENVQKDDLREVERGGDRIFLTCLPDDKSGIRTLQDADIGLGGAWVSRWGADPIRPGAGAPGWLLSQDNFPNHRKATDADFDAAPSRHRQAQDALVVPNALMPLSATSDLSQATEPPERQRPVPNGDFMSVALLTYEQRFDPEQEIWYADIDIDPIRLDSPFVRLGIVRFQPHARKALQVSEPVVAWGQVLPKRTVTAHATLEKGIVSLKVTSAGLAGDSGLNRPNWEKSSAQRARVRMTLLQRRANRNAGGVRPIGTATAESQISWEGMTWTAHLKVNREEFINGTSLWSVYVEEVDRMRPATYPDEPRYHTTEDEHFAESGPRFAAELKLDRLIAWVAAQPLG